MTNLIGQSLGRYHILEQLGEGGMATVYKAFDTRLERDVAIKIIRRNAFPPDQLDRILKRFEREAKSLARLSHPNIIKVIDYGEYNGAPYLVMEYMPGGTLKEKLKGRAMQWQEAVRLLIPIAQALEYAHEQKIIHRDIKPSNILLMQKGQPMLTDFGIAKILEVEETATLTGTGMGVGTPEYMAPEQWTGSATAQTDIYSLGVVLYEMMTGRKPYSADTPAAILLKQATEPLPRPGTYVSDLPDSIEKILLKALARNPQDRYQDAGALVIAMENLTSNNHSRATSNERSTRDMDDSSETIDASVFELQKISVPDKSKKVSSRHKSETNAAANPSQRKINIALLIGFGVIGMILASAMIGWLVGGGIATIFSSDTPLFTLTPLKSNTSAPTLTTIKTFTPAPTITITVSPTKEATKTPIVLTSPKNVEGSIEYAKEYYGISCGFTVIIYDNNTLPVQYEISWKNLTKGEKYSERVYSPVDGKVIYYSPPSGYSISANDKPTPLIAGGNSIQISVLTSLDLSGKKIYSEPALINLVCAP